MMVIMGDIVVGDMLSVRYSLSTSRFLSLGMLHNSWNILKNKWEDVSLTPRSFIVLDEVLVVKAVNTQVESVIVEGVS